MPSGADLFVVCKQCGSEVSPYITECPYCGNRLRRRAPKLPRVHAPTRPSRNRSRLGAVFARGPHRAAEASTEVRFGYGSDRWVGTRPYATIALVAAACGLWVASRASPSLRAELAVVGPLPRDGWRLLSSPFVYVNGVYAFTTLITVGLFGWLLERRRGPAVVLALFFGACAAGALLALAVYPFPVVSGGGAGALALLAAWAGPDVLAARAGAYYEGDLLGAGVLAALALAMPFAVDESSWLAGVSGGALGLMLGLGLGRVAAAD